MLITDRAEYLAVWDRVNTELGFRPDCRHRTHSFDCYVPFRLDKPYVVYDISQMEDVHCNRMKKLVHNAFVQAAKDGKRMYALDWQHSAFLFNPRNPDEMKSVKTEDGYSAYFPDFYPDGDYYFFIDEAFRFGYLGHPWREEVWIFGDALIQAFEEIFQKLGWREIHRKI